MALPNKLKKLILGGRYNQLLTFPPSIEEVHLDRDFNQLLELPPSLKSLSLECRRFDHPLLLPANLNTLRISTPLPNPGNVLPTFLLQIVFPPKLRVLIWECAVSVPVALPDTLQAVEFGRTFQQHVDLPHGLEIAKFDNPAYSMPLVLPSTLKYIILNRDYDFALALPPGCVRRSYWKALM